MPTCRKCVRVFPNRTNINGIIRNIHSRKYCLICSPWGYHNTRIMDGDTTKDKRLGIRKLPHIPAWHGNGRPEVKIRAIQYKGGRCLLCGYDRSTWAMCFHHRDPRIKDFGVGGSTKSWAKIQNEINKCDLLCLNCHCEEHGRLLARVFDDVVIVTNTDVLKICSQCGNPTPLSEFYRNKGRPDGKDLYAECKRCFRRKMDILHTNHRDILIRENGGACSICGYNKSPYALCFHHKDPSTKLFTIASKLYASLDALRGECLKCTLLCMNCHAEKHERLYLISGSRGT